MTKLSTDECPLALPGVGDRPRRFALIGCGRFTGQDELAPTLKRDLRIDENIENVGNQNAEQGEHR